MASNAVQFASGKYGKALNYAALDGLTSYTVEGWFKKNTSSSTRDALFMLALGTGTDYRAYLEEEATHTGINFGHRYTGNSADGYKDAGVLVDDTWTHIAAVFIQTQKTKIYKNAVEITYTLQNTPSGTYYTTNSADVHIAGWPAGFSKPNFEGAIGCFRIWSVARSSTELSDNKDYYLDPSQETGLVFNCNFDEESGTTVDNDVTSSNDLLLTGSPSWTTGPTLTVKNYGGTSVKDIIGGFIPFAR